MTTPTRTLVIKATSGADRPETVNQAFTVAAAAVAAGAVVSLWLTGEASWLALPGRTDDVALDHAAPIGDLLAIVLDAGTVTVCTQCAVRRGFGTQDLVPGIRIAGAAVFVEEILAVGAQALVY
ncbi:MAG: DsrE family protein [Cellulomonas sp.]